MDQGGQPLNASQAKEIMAERRIIMSHSLHTLHWLVSRWCCSDKIMDIKKNKGKIIYQETKMQLTPRDENRATLWQSCSPGNFWRMRNQNIPPSQQEECGPASTPFMEPLGTIYRFYPHFLPHSAFWGWGVHVTKLPVEKLWDLLLHLLIFCVFRKSAAEESVEGGKSNRH